MLLRLSLIFVLWGLGSVVRGQTPFIDSLQFVLSTELSPLEETRTLLELAWEYDQIEDERRILVAEKAMEIALQKGFTKEEANAYKINGLIQDHLSDFSMAECYMKEAWAIYEGIQDTSGLLAISNNLGRLLSTMGKCEEASELMNKGLSLAQNANDQVKELYIATNYIYSLAMCNLFHNCIEVGRRYLPKARELGNPLITGNILSALGFAHYRLEEDSLGLEVLLEGKKIAEEYEMQGMLSVITNNLGNIYIGLDRYQEAYDMYKLSQDLDQGVPNKEDDAISFSNMGLALSFLKRYDEALFYMKKGLKTHLSRGQSIFLPQAYEGIGNTYAYTGQFDSAYHYINLSLLMRDSLLNEENQARIQELNAKYETEKIAKELAQSKLETTQYEQKYQQLLYGISAIFLILLGFILFIILNLRRKRVEEEKKRIELEYRVLRTQMNPHFIFNALNSIQGYFAEREFAEGNEYLGDFGQLMRRVLDHSSKPKISLHDELETLDLYLKLEQVRLKNKLTYEITLDEDVEESMIELPPLVIQPFAENAIWHGISPKEGTGHINISCSLDPYEDILHVHVEDNGIGLKAAELHHLNHGKVSKGINITKERLGPKGNVWVEELYTENGKTKGTRAIIHIPLEND